jgi:drug/metabolite transporter (DMT)-like permease
VAAAILAAGGERVRLAASWPRLLALVLLAGPLYQVLVFAGYRYAPAAGGALLLTALLPAFALLLTCIALRTAPAPQAALGCAAALGGLVLFAGPAMGGLSASGAAIFGLAALLWAVLNELVRRWRIAPFPLAVTLSLWSAALLPLWLLLRSGAGPGPAVPLAELLLQVAYHGWLVAFAATALFFAAVRRAGTQTAAVLQTLSPVFSAALGAVLLGETLSRGQLAGMALALAGVMVTAWSRSRLAGPRPALPASRWRQPAADAAR